MPPSLLLFQRLELRVLPANNTQEDGPTGLAMPSTSSTSATKIPNAQDMQKFSEKSGVRGKKK